MADVGINPSSLHNGGLAKNTITQANMNEALRTCAQLVQNAQEFVTKNRDGRQGALDIVASDRRISVNNRGTREVNIRSKQTESRKNVEACRRQLSEQEESAKRHLQLQLIDPNPLMRAPLTANHKSTPNGVDPMQLWNLVENESEVAREELRNLLSTQKPAYLLAVVGVFGVIGLTGGLILAAKAQRPSVFFIVLFVQLIVGGIVALFLRRFSRETIETRFSAWGDSMCRTEELLTNYIKAIDALAETQCKQAETQFQKEQEDLNNKSSLIANEFDTRLQTYSGELREQVRTTGLYCQELARATSFAGADWEATSWGSWLPFNADDGGAHNPTVKLGKLTVGCAALKDLKIDAPISFSVPALASFQSGKGVLIKAPGTKKADAIGLIQSIMFRTLANLAPGMVRMALFDPLGLGQNVAAFIPLGVHDERLITSKAWSEPQKIEEELAKLSDHLTDIIQSRLRNDHKNIEEFNERSPALREPYRLVVALDFPVNFRADAARRLISLAQNGSRCGVYPLVFVDTDLLATHSPHGFSLQPLEQNLEVIEWIGEKWKWRGYEGFEFSPDCIDVTLQKDLIDRVTKEIGVRAKGEMSVRIPLKDVLKMDGIEPENYWSASTANGIEIPLGPLNVTQTMQFKIGDSAHHGIIIGRTGSGKSKLMDVIITTLALKYSPDEIQFYLVDLKSGVGFKPYASAQLPHARVIAIDSEREYALSVLRALEKQMDDRHVTFREAGRENITEFRKENSSKILPRILLVIDEFQNLFLEEDAIASQAKTILERLTREGRSAGVHVLLGSQSLAGKASNLPSAALGQIGIRIALMCNASDAQAIMAHDNTEARILSRPGEAIYNDHNGLIEGNKRFQVAFLDDGPQRDYFKAIKELQDRRMVETEQLVFEGNAMAKLDDCRQFRSLIENGGGPSNVRRAAAWLGEPISLADPVSVSLGKQAGSNLLVVVNQEREGVGMLASAVLSLAAIHARDDAEFFILNFTNVEEEWYEFVKGLGHILPQTARVGARPELTSLMAEIWEECEIRLAHPDKSAKKRYLLIFGLQRAKDLRADESFRSNPLSIREKTPSPADNFASILKEGPEVGIHVLAWCDMAMNVKRTLGRNLINEFNYRVTGRMSQDDSQFIIESTAAAKIDREFRAIFYDEDRPGYLEKFRPFAIPSNPLWLEELAANLSLIKSTGKGA